MVYFFSAFSLYLKGKNIASYFTQSVQIQPPTYTPTTFDSSRHFSNQEAVQKDIQKHTYKSLLQNLRHALISRYSETLSHILLLFCSLGCTCHGWVWIVTSQQVKLPYTVTGRDMDSFVHTPILEMTNITFQLVYFPCVPSHKMTYDVTIQLKIISGLNFCLLI